MQSSTKSNLIPISAAVVVVALMVLAGYLTSRFSIRAAEHLQPENDRHALIAITCPYAPYFGIGGERGSEWRLIVEAFSDFGQQAQHLYVSYEDAWQYFQSDQVTGVWICGGMGIPGEDYHSSAPLLKRRFVVATLAENEIEFEQLDELTTTNVGAHPDVLQVLKPQIAGVQQDMENLRKIPNHALLAALLLTKQIDALITEKSVFEESLRQVPSEAHPTQQIRFHLLFQPIHPRIVFKDQALRDRFNEALKKTALTQLNDK